MRLELQADCFAGVWAHYAQQREALLEPGDVEEALNAAAAIGDDRLQKQTQGASCRNRSRTVLSAQRQRWLQRELESGDVRQCDTFGASTL